MTKQQLIERMATDADISKEQAKVALNSFMNAVQDSLKADERLSLVGFGTFSRGFRKQRIGLNPKTKEPLTIPAKYVARFKPSKKLEDTLN